MKHLLIFFAFVAECRTARAAAEEVSRRTRPLHCGPERLFPEFQRRLWRLRVFVPSFSGCVSSGMERGTTTRPDQQLQSHVAQTGQGSSLMGVAPCGFTRPIRSGRRGNVEQLAGSLKEVQRFIAQKDHLGIPLFLHAEPHR